MKMKNLITGAGGSASIGLTRCLKNYFPKAKIIGVESDLFNSALSETNSTYLIPRASDKDYIKVLNHIILKEKIDFLYTQTDSEISAIAKNIRKIQCKTLIPSFKIISTCQNKYKLNKHLFAKGIPVPKTILIKTSSDLKNATKYKLFWLRNVTGAGAKGAFLAENFEQAIWWINFQNGWGHFTASEYMPEDNYGCDLLFAGGKLVFSQIKRRLEYVLSKANIVGITGTTGILETVSTKFDLNDISERAVTLLDNNISGAFSVDIKCDSLSKPYVTEINPGRFLSSSMHLFAETKFPAPALVILVANDQKLHSFPKRNPIKGGTILIRQLDRKPATVNLKNHNRLRKKFERKHYVKLET